MKKALLAIAGITAACWFLLNTKVGIVVLTGLALVLGVMLAADDVRDWIDTRRFFEHEADHQRRDARHGGDLDPTLPHSHAW